MDDALGFVFRESVVPRFLIFYAKTVAHHLPYLKEWGIEGVSYALEGNETDKTLTRYGEVIDFLITQGAQKQDTLVAVGGGAVLDLIGFVAMTYKRGMPLFFVPTTLLAMVDASIGGKNGVNHSAGKNLIGGFYSPTKTFLDSRFLTTLSEKQWQDGYVEMLKIALLDPEGFLEELTFPPTFHMIEKARELKEWVVAQDGFEKGLRCTLNFGHTIGHALEKVLGYQLSHGEAVAHGMRVEIGLLGNHPQYTKLLEKLPFQTPLPAIDRQELRNALLQDKKNRGTDILISDIFSSKEGCYTRRFTIEQVLESYR